MQAGQARGGQGGMSPFGRSAGKGAGDGAPDGPARVVKPGDWKAVPDGSMKGFPLASFNMPGRAPAKPEPAEQKLAAMAQSARKAEDAHKRALEKAIKDGEDAARAALARGREAGLIEGERVAGEKYAQVLEALQNNTRGVLEALGREKNTLFLEFEGQVLELVSGCIHRVFDGLAAEHADAVLPLLKRAVSAIGEAVVVTIKVHPDDFKTVEAQKPYWLPVNAILKDVRVVVDDRISKGGCFVESDSTSVSAHANEMADRIDEEMKKVFLAKVASVRNPAAVAIDQAASGNLTFDDAAPNLAADDEGEPAP